MACKPLSRRGFTFVELILVTLVMVILLAASLPAFSHSAARMRVERTAFSMAQLFRYARERAVSQSQTILWVWSPESRTVKLEQLSEGGARAALTGRFVESEAVAQDVTVSLIRDKDIVETVGFFEDGTSESARLTLTHVQSQYTITVDGSTGQVTLVKGLVVD